MKYKVTTDKKKRTVRYRNMILFLILISLSCIVFPVRNTYAAEEYRIQKTTLMIKTGADYTARILNNGIKVSQKKFKWSSSNPKCAKVVNGKISGLKPGSATITAQNSQVKLSCEVYICNKTEIVSFKKYEKQVKLEAGKTLILEPQKHGKKITYSSSDKTAATVSKKGKVTAKKAGSTKITCISYGTNRYVSEIEVVVTTPAPEVPKDFQKPLDGVTHYILHRGDQTVAPENSMPAFDAAGRSEAEYVETDVRETKDGVLVLSHDDSLLRMCGEDKLISEMTYEEIKQYPIINGTNASQYSDNVVPTLEEYIACCNKYSMTPVIEIKSISTEQGMSSFLQILSKSQKEPVLICFHIDILSKLREMGFTGKMQWIRTVRITTSIIQQCKKYDLDISAEYKNISMYDINNAHQNGIRISIWLCQNEDMVDIFKKMGADYITYEKWTADGEET